MLEFSKLYKFVVKNVILHCRSDTTKHDQINDQLLCAHFKSRHPMTNFGHLSWSFLV